ncbi:proteoglycan 4-like [Pseudochaenichthys georgianus]|uniref:proteoglycan 4-like n=1 Tax=Pseudochaenichthys georgianus TaxID=52239 RepID=UPI00146F7389|nr:proteoglycan 4-like [Pseudochaenichthys georgianus]
MEADTAVEDGNDQNSTFNAIVPKTEPEEPNTMLKGMKGCQLTQNDLEFMEKIKEDKLIKQLQGDLNEVQKLVSKELMQLELALASREKAQADLKPSCEDLMGWVKEVLSMTSLSTQLADLDLDCFLDTVTKETVQKASEEKRIQIPRMENMVANKKKREAKERGQLEQNVASQQLKVHGLMSQMANLICELSQEEDAYKALEIRKNTQEAAGMEADKVVVKEKPQDPKVQAKTRGKGILKAVTFQEQAKIKTKSRRKLADGKTESGKHDKEKPTKSVKESKGPQKRVQKQEASSQEASSQEASSQEASSQEASSQSVGGRRKKPAATKPKSGVKTEEAPSTTRREALSTTRREALSTTRREAPSTTRREAPSTTRREALSTTRREALSTTRREALSTTRREALSTTRREALSTTRREALSTTRREALSTTRREALSTTRREAPSTTRREAPSTTRREAPSTTRREAPSTPRREAPSTTRLEAPSTPRREAPSTPRREAPSTTRLEAPSTPRREALSTPQQEAPPHDRKEETTVLRRSKRIASKSH